MNTEKLNILAAQAGFDVERLRAPYPSGFPREDMLALESFAELIVRECIGVVKGGSFLHDQAPTAIFARECSGAIKQHFGVEE